MRIRPRKRPRSGRFSQRDQRDRPDSGKALDESGLVQADSGLPTGAARLPRGPPRLASLDAARV